MLTFESAWEPVGGTIVRTTACSPIPCDGSETEVITTEWDNLPLEVTVDPKAAVITGSRIDDQSTADGTDVFAYTWTLRP